MALDGSGPLRRGCECTSGRTGAEGDGGAKWEVARRLMGRAEVVERWLDVRTDVLGARASRSKAASGRWIDR